MQNIQNRNVQIQIQDINGNWFAVNSVPNHNQMITGALNTAVRQYGKKARAMNSDGIVLDIKM